MVFFTTLKATLAGAWIPILLLMCIQMIMMSVVKEGGKRAVDTSWYTCSVVKTGVRFEFEKLGLKVG